MNEKTFVWHRVEDEPLPSDEQYFLVESVNGTLSLAFHIGDEWRQVGDCRQLKGIYKWCKIYKDE